MGISVTCTAYRMVGIFCGVLIFVIIVIDLALMKSSHPQKLMPTVIWYYASS